MGEAQGRRPPCRLRVGLNAVSTVLYFFRQAYPLPGRERKSSESVSPVSRHWTDVQAGPWGQVLGSAELAPLRAGQERYNCVRDHCPGENYAFSGAGKDGLPEAFRCAIGLVP